MLQGLLSIAGVVVTLVAGIWLLFGACLILLPMAFGDSGVDSESWNRLVIGFLMLIIGAAGFEALGWTESHTSGLVRLAICHILLGGLTFPAWLSMWKAGLKRKGQA